MAVRVPDEIEEHCRGLAGVEDREGTVGRPVEEQALERLDEHRVSQGAGSGVVAHTEVATRQRLDHFEVVLRHAAFDLQGVEQALAGTPLRHERRPDRLPVIGLESLGQRVEDVPLG